MTMDYEKKYKEALERARLSRLQLLDIGEEATENEHIFPELKESEDEMIRKEIINLINLLWKHFNFPYHRNKYEEFLAWLEKQGNQTSAEWSEEDENRFNNLIRLVENSNEGNATKQGFITFINKFKSIKPY